MSSKNAKKSEQRKSNQQQDSAQASQREQIQPQQSVTQPVPGEQIQPLQVEQVQQPMPQIEQAQVQPEQQNQPTAVIPHKLTRTRLNINTFMSTIQEKATSSDCRLFTRSVYS